MKWRGDAIAGEQNTCGMKRTLEILEQEELNGEGWENRAEGVCEGMTNSKTLKKT